MRLCVGVDPLELQDAERDVELLPRVDFPDIKGYLVQATSFVSRKQLKAYKSMDGQNYLTSGWVQQPGVKVLSDSTIVVGKVCHSQSFNENPLTAWLLITEDGVKLARNRAPRMSSHFNLYASRLLRPFRPMGCEPRVDSSHVFAQYTGIREANQVLRRSAWCHFVTPVLAKLLTKRDHCRVSSSSTAEATRNSLICAIVPDVRRCMVREWVTVAERALNEASSPRAECRSTLPAILSVGLPVQDGMLGPAPAPALRR
ncbi:hypothetical protein HPB51_003956 [Rhipicephalus microplus]|uniref:Uncharacterized protein n=1 Tax=Rhipicephalus microplus TaxID=6941 RepID=A0A9J6D8M5_RHIMP|nr:hypothetical protein HPB51_003956 [Rhipicephalus microplus]